MHPSQDGEIPFDQEVALTMLERGWDRVMAISDTLDDWTDFSSDYAQGLTHLNRFKEFSLSNSTYKSDPDISFCNPFDSPLTATAFSREGSFLQTSTPLAKIPPPIIHKEEPPEALSFFYELHDTEEIRYNELLSKQAKDRKR
jgi:hypothetical protein